ncbi:lytic polysaccharide monooxygenase [Trematosphaeria pertusa]|uniref:lytic cellulose monooxygenase (C4-dehydrogenating) n=1 Tax=Trematosphaeria pertusa TaxID=390896 RepID=A0A6A6IQA0_9PLEO|nr:lytic polysaccharide monooxygenase [Trematosphaeria pertusa]KAF2251683.1 lytic polysaccharide monooxygenase [Trematosphaeria pertusa]
MRWSPCTAVAFAAIFTPVFAHWNYESVLLNGKDTGVYEYVRRTKNSNGPITDVSSKDIICNNGGIDDDVMSATKTLSVKPGDQVGFRIRDIFGHPGIQQVYLSKAPGMAQSYKGDGDWFKVYSLTTSNLTNDPIFWAPFKDNVGIYNFTFTLPTTLPSGQYLMRAEGLALHSAGTVGGAQFYIGCAQLEVTGGGRGSPGPTVKFPGAYTGNEPGILVGLYWPPLRNYTAPGPAVWPTNCEDHSPNYFGKTSDGDCTPLAKGATG